ncbi:MAG: hypothetical protein HOV78_24335 [Hamadaea sp.]|nr:hypothetical protein [Hamadaea sp.]NUT02184.1 hypothetical protein [Hamadaea sp.]
MRRGLTMITAMTLTATLTATLAACSPAVDGVGGVRLDGAGRLVAVLAWCPEFGRPATVILYPAESGGRVGEPLLRLRRTGEDPEGGLLELALSDPGPDWHTDDPTPTLVDEDHYEVRTWDESGEHRLASFPFTPAELRTAPSDQPVLTKKYAGDGRYDTEFLSVPELQQAAANECD